MGRRVGQYCRTSRWLTESYIESEIECVESEWMERDGLRQHVVVVGSTAEKLQQTPERLSPGSSSHRAPICVYRKSTLPEEEGQWVELFFFVLVQSLSCGSIMLNSQKIRQKCELDDSWLKSSLSFVSVSTFNFSSSFSRAQ